MNKSGRRITTGGSITIMWGQIVLQRSNIHFVRTSISSNLSGQNHIAKCLMRGLQLLLQFRGFAVLEWILFFSCVFFCFLKMLLVAIGLQVGPCARLGAALICSSTLVHVLHEWNSPESAGKASRPARQAAAPWFKAWTAQSPSMLLSSMSGW